MQFSLQNAHTVRIPSERSIMLMPFARISLRHRSIQDEICVRFDYVTNNIHTYFDQKAQQHAHIYFQRRRWNTPINDKHVSNIFFTIWRCRWLHRIKTPTYALHMYKYIYSHTNTHPIQRALSPKIFDSFFSPRTSDRHIFFIAYLEFRSPALPQSNTPHLFTHIACSE